MPTAIEHHGRATSLRLAGDMTGAAEHYKRVLALVPDSAATWNELGTALRSLGRLDEAVNCFRHALVLKPDLADAYRNLALGEQVSADGVELPNIAALADATDLPIEESSAAASHWARRWTMPAVSMKPLRPTNGRTRRIGQPVGRGRLVRAVAPDNEIIIPYARFVPGLVGNSIGGPGLYRRNAALGHESRRADCGQPFARV
jgi:hypothetical protein